MLGNEHCQNSQVSFDESNIKTRKNSTSGNQEVMFYPYAQTFKKIIRRMQMELNCKKEVSSEIDIFSNVKREDLNLLDKS